MRAFTSGRQWTAAMMVLRRKGKGGCGRTDAHQMQAKTRRRFCQQDSAGQRQRRQKIFCPCECLPPAPASAAAVMRRAAVGWMLMQRPSSITMQPSVALVCNPLFHYYGTHCSISMQHPVGLVCNPLFHYYAMHRSITMEHTVPLVCNSALHEHAAGRGCLPGKKQP